MPLSLSTTLLRKFLVIGKAQALPAIPSEQLQAGLITIEESASTGKLHVPHYWAIIAHDGRGPSPGAAGTGKLLVWFKDPKNDPRYPGGIYPIRKSQVKHLTKTQFRKWRRINQVIINRYRQSTGRRNLTSADYRAMVLPMIVAQNSPGDRGIVTGTPFFSNEAGGGMFGFQKKINAVGAKVVSKYVTDRLQRKGLLHKTITKNIHI